MTHKKTYIIDGTRFSTLEEFYQEITDILIPDAPCWGRNLNAFHDILSGGFGTPDDGFILVWRHSTLSKKRFGYPETVRQLQKRLKTCHPTNREHVSEDIEQAKRREGQTIFDVLIEIIHHYSPPNSYENYAIELILT